MISVPGGGHWGGGIVISARDLALMGCWSRRAAPGTAAAAAQGWTAELVKPCPVAPFYGLMWWLNTDRRQFAAASERSYFAFGWGSHIVWIDPDNDLVTGAALGRAQEGRWFRRTSSGCPQEMSLDFSAVPRMPDGRTALETINSVAATSQAIKVPMGNGGQMMWHVWGEGSGKPRCCCSMVARARGSTGSATCCRCRSISRSTPPTCRGWAIRIRRTTCVTSGR
jgi:hypothetical protein